MKSRLMSVLLVLLLSASMTACSGNENNLDPNNSGNADGGKISATSVPTNSPSPSASPDGTSETAEPQTPSDHESAVTPYQAILLNNAAFFSTDNKKEVFLNDFLTNKELYGTIFKTSRFAVLDMDGDKSPEVVLELTVENNPEFYEILHMVDGKVYGYNIVYRGLEWLKADGTFYYSNGAADNGYGKLKFQSNTYETDTLGYMESAQTIDDMTISYFIDNKPVTEESYDSFTKEQAEKEDVVWLEFSQKNIETALSFKP